MYNVLMKERGRQKKNFLNVNYQERQRNMSFMCVWEMEFYGM